MTFISVLFGTGQEHDVHPVPNILSLLQMPLSIGYTCPCQTNLKCNVTPMHKLSFAIHEFYLKLFTKFTISNFQMITQVPKVWDY